jgi:outer membrane protein assembly factor BamD (BamD/ComL family)
MSRLRTTLPLAFLLVVAFAAPALAGPRYATSDSASDQRSAAYHEGQRALDRQKWGDASLIFGKIAAGEGPETDAALYWKAYADWKQKMKKESLDGLRQLVTTYPRSEWADDAKALELEIKDGKGARGTQDTDDEEL